jgi:hypothetical protein
MDLFTIQNYQLNGFYTINVNINFTGITNDFNTLMAIHFSRAFTKAIEININDFHNSIYPETDLLFIERTLSYKFEVSTGNEELHRAYLDIFNALKKSSTNLVEEVKGLYSKDGSKMTDYLTKYISSHVLNMELNKAGNNRQKEQKKLKV